MPKSAGITLRPYQLLCLVCSLGEQNADLFVQRQKDLLDIIRKSPDIPITLQCNAGEVFAYQDPGPADDTLEGAEYNAKRDLEILYKLNLPPGCTLPARILLHRLLDSIEDVSGICGYAAVTSEAWKGCAKADSGNYQRGRGQGINTVCPPRTKQDMVEEKDKSLTAMYTAETVHVRPHILLCALCQLGGGTLPPYPEDNLPELIALIKKEPETLITLVPHADWMMCAPCPMRASGNNGCVINKGAGGLPNQLRDLRLLQQLGLTYGATLRARDLYQRIFERISGTDFCRIDLTDPSVWWSGCGSTTEHNRQYQEGKRLLQADLERVSSEEGH